MVGLDPAALDMNPFKEMFNVIIRYLHKERYTYLFCPTGSII
jgi:hypothetical protein